jgi:hypothetical protein
MKKIYLIKKENTKKSTKNYINKFKEIIFF